MITTRNQDEVTCSVLTDPFKLGKRCRAVLDGTNSCPILCSIGLLQQAPVLTQMRHAPRATANLRLCIRSTVIVEIHNIISGEVLYDPVVRISMEKLTSLRDRNNCHIQRGKGSRLADINYHKRATVEKLVVPNELMSCVCQPCLIV